MLTLTLPWPPRALSPNAREHWTRLARAKRVFRAACYLTAREQEARKLDADRLNVRLVFFPPNRHTRDADNCLAAMKSGLDGLADLLGVDDSRWRISFELSEQVGGMVKVEVSHA